MRSSLHKTYFVLSLVTILSKSFSCQAGLHTLPKELIGEICTFVTNNKFDEEAKLYRLLSQVSKPLRSYILKAPFAHFNQQLIQECAQITAHKNAILKKLFCTAPKEEDKEINLLRIVFEQHLFNIAKILIHKKIGINHALSHQKIPLDKEDIALLIAKNINPEKQFTRQTFLLFVKAIEYEWWTVLKDLLKNGFNLKKNLYLSQRLPFHFAIQKGNVQIIQYLLDNGADLKQMAHIDDIGDGHALHAAANNLKVLKFLHKKWPAGIHTRYEDDFEDYGEFVLMAAVKHNNIPVTRWLIDQKVDVNAHNSQFSALHLASYNKLFEILKMLVEAGANVNIIAAEGKNVLQPLSLKYAPSPEIVDLLAENGINVNHQDFGKRTPLHYYCTTVYNGTEILKVLIKHNANPLMKNSHGTTPLELAEATLEKYKKENHPWLEAQKKHVELLREYTETYRKNAVKKQKKLS